MDLRLPIGVLFTLVGLMMAIYGLVTRDSEIYARSLGLNVNLWWGAFLAVFGVIMFWFARRRPQ